MTDPIELVATGFDVAPLRDVLRDEALWDWNKARTENPDSPHYGCSDIWARYAPPSEYGLQGPFKCVWYEQFGEALLKPLVAFAYDIVEMVKGRELGGVLITKIPAGGEVRPHSDHGWHAEYYEKFALSIQANPEQEFCFETKKLVTAPGDLFWFYNQEKHWVTNPSTEDRMTAIFCIKR